MYKITLQLFKHLITLSLPYVMNTGTTPI